MMNMLDLSGYAIVYGELDGTSYWRVVKALWDGYFSQHSDPSAVTSFFIAVTRYRQNQLAMPSRDLIRTSWKVDLERRLRERGLVEDGLGWDPDREDVGKHESKLIRVLTRSRYMIQDPHDVFLAVYSLERPAFSELELPYKARSLAEELADEPDEGSQREEGDNQPA